MHSVKSRNTAPGAECRFQPREIGWRAGSAERYATAAVPARRSIGIVVVWRIRIGTTAKTLQCSRQIFCSLLEEKLNLHAI